MVTIDPDGRPQISLVWVGLDGDHILVAHQAERRKVFNLRRDDYVLFRCSAVAGRTWP